MQEGKANFHEVGIEARLRSFKELHDDLLSKQWLQRPIRILASILFGIGICAVASISLAIIGGVIYGNMNNIPRYYTGIWVLLSLLAGFTGFVLTYKALRRRRLLEIKEIEDALKRSAEELNAKYPNFVEGLGGKNRLFDQRIVMRALTEFPSNDKYRPRDRGRVVQKVVIQGNTIEALSWPEKCSGCGVNFKEAATVQSAVKIQRALFVPSKPKTLSLRLCKKCSKKASKFKAIANFGSVSVLLAFIGPIFMGLSGPQQMYGAGATFNVGAILYWVADRSRKKAVGLWCKRLSKNRWAFWFRNDMFRKDFQERNLPLIERI